MNVLRTILLAGLVSLMAVSAYAIEISDAKAQGLVGEATTGYLAATNGSPSKEVQKLIKEVNDGRKQLFAEIASESGVTEEQVRLRFYQRAIKNTKPGNYIQLGDGSWAKIP